MRKERKGFTLIELMIVVAIIAIIAAIAIPSLLRSRLTSNESAAQGTLKTICTAQAQMKSNAWIDEDTDGIGEYGTLGQLAGIDTCDNGSGDAVAINPPYVTAVLGVVPDGGTYSLKSGYYYNMFLDDADVQNREQMFVCYAWPQERATTGNKAFAVTQEGTVYFTLAKVAAYTGEDDANVPAVDAAFIENALNPAAWVGRFPVASNDETGTDGNIWAVAGD